MLCGRLILRDIVPFKNRPGFWGSPAAVKSASSFQIRPAFLPGWG
jgi:hypothetical protein